MRAGAVCLCKKPACRRYFLLLEPPKQPGRKSSKRRADSPTSVINEGEHPPIIEIIDEVWGIRCAAALAPARVRPARDPRARADGPLALCTLAGMLTSRT